MCPHGLDCMKCWCHQSLVGSVSCPNLLSSFYFFFLCKTYLQESFSKLSSNPNGSLLGRTLMFDLPNIFSHDICFAKYIIIYSFL